MKTTKNGLTLIVDIDENYTENPRDNENLWHMVCWHKRYKLGDEHDFRDPSDFHAFCEINQNEIACILPLYLYDHSGITISTTDFNDRWDNGQVGYIYCLKDEANKQGYVSDEDIEKKLKSEVVDYDEYLTGYLPYYYFSIIDENNTQLESVTGFKNEDEKTMLNQMKENVDEIYQNLFDKLIKENEICL